MVSRSSTCLTVCFICLYVFFFFFDNVKVFVHLFVLFYLNYTIHWNIKINSIERSFLPCWYCCCCCCCCYCYYYYLLFYSFSHQYLSDSKSPLVSRTLLRILAVLSNAVIWIVSTRPPTSKSSRPFNNPLVIVPKVPITIGTIVTFMFHSIFNSLPRSKYSSFFSHSFSFFFSHSFRVFFFTFLQFSQ